MIFTLWCSRIGIAGRSYTFRPESGCFTGYEVSKLHLKARPLTSPAREEPSGRDFTVLDHAGIGEKNSIESWRCTVSSIRTEVGENTSRCGGETPEITHLVAAFCADGANSSYAGAGTPP